jgi:thiol-disulfide isomerase/thioredoxin
VLAWKNGAVNLASLKGKVVLLNFWGYWCGGCVVEMPTLMHLYDKYHDRGLAVVTVHVDAANDVDTVAKLDARTAWLRTGIWKGRDLPFPTALAAGHPYGHSRSLAGAAFGILGYPTTVVIARDGLVLGETRKQVALDLTADEKTVDAEMEKLLGAK